MILPIRYPLDCACKRGVAEKAKRQERSTKSALAGWLFSPIEPRLVRARERADSPFRIIRKVKESLSGMSLRSHPCAKINWSDRLEKVYQIGGYPKYVLLVGGVGWRSTDTPGQVARSSIP